MIIRFRTRRRCLPKAARKLSSKNIECEACGLVRAGRAQAMASLSFPADTAGAMLHAQSPFAAELALAPQMPLPAAHTVSPGDNIVPIPAVGPPVAPRWRPLVACMPGIPAVSPAQNPPQAHDYSVSMPGSGAGGPGQQTPLPQPVQAIKSYSPADALAQPSRPAVAACSLAAYTQAWAGSGGELMLASAEEPEEEPEEVQPASKAKQSSELSSQDSPQDSDDSMQNSTSR